MGNKKSARKVAGAGELGHYLNMRPKLQTMPVGVLNYDLRHQFIKKRSTLPYPLATRLLWIRENGTAKFAKTL